MDSTVSFSFTFLIPIPTSSSFIIIIIIELVVDIKGVIVINVLKTNLFFLHVKSIIGQEVNPNVMTYNEEVSLCRSIIISGFTNPIIVNSNEEANGITGKYRIIDGYHRYQIIKEGYDLVNSSKYCFVKEFSYDAIRLYNNNNSYEKGYVNVLKAFIGKCLGEEVPSVVLNLDKTNAMYAELLHNEARGKHKFSIMKEIVYNLVQDGEPIDSIAAGLNTTPKAINRILQINGVNHK